MITHPHLHAALATERQAALLAEAEAALSPDGTYWHCPNGSHLCIYDDQETYFAGIEAFLSRLPAGNQASPGREH